MNIALTINCPNCSKVIKRKIFTGSSKKIEVDVSYFENTSWRCSNCNKIFSIDNIEIHNIEYTQ